MLTAARDQKTLSDVPVQNSRPTAPSPRGSLRRRPRSPWAVILFADEVEPGRDAQPTLYLQQSPHFMIFRKDFCSQGIHLCPLPFDFSTLTFFCASAHRDPDVGGLLCRCAAGTPLPCPAWLNPSREENGQSAMAVSGNDPVANSRYLEARPCCRDTDGSRRPQPRRRILN
jgi:hypothetical protein